MARTPLRTIRVADDVWEPSIAKTAQAGTTVTALVVERLSQYLTGEVALVADPDVLSYLSDLVDTNDEDSDVRRRAVAALAAALR